MLHCQNSLNLDWFNGLGITIHETDSTKIYLDDFDVMETETRGLRRKSFKARLTFKVQDHFGLDIGDVNRKVFELSSWFCFALFCSAINLMVKADMNESNFSIWI